MTKTALAKAVGISRQQLSRYATEGCPMTTPEAVQAWRENHRLPRRGITLQPGETLQGRLLAGQIAKVEEEARHKKLKNDQLAGKLYDADDVERDVAELTSLIRARLESIPDELAMEWPEASRVQLTQRLQDKIRLILTTMSNWRLSSWTLEEVAGLDEANGVNESEREAADAETARLRAIIAAE